MALRALPVEDYKPRSVIWERYGKDVKWADGTAKTTPAVGAGDQCQCGCAVQTSQRRQVVIDLKYSQVWGGLLLHTLISLCLKMESVHVWFLEPSLRPHRPLRGITGGAAGIGLACAHLLAGRGARVALLDRDPTVVDVAAKLGAGHLGIAVDLAQVGQIQHTIDSVFEQFQRLDYLINSAGVVLLDKALQVSESAWDTTWISTSRPCSWRQPVPGTCSPKAADASSTSPPRPP